MWNKDYKDMLLTLSNEKVEFLLVGAYALAAHGFPRATLDIDIWVNPTSENAKKVYSSLAKFGTPLDQVGVEDFASQDIIFQIGVPPRRIDILTAISGLSFEEAEPQALETEIDGLTVKILSIEHLIQNKLATGRDKDIVDATMLKRHQQK